jgi:hypothetical protein
MATIERRNFVGVESVIQAIAKDLANNGFDIINVNDNDDLTIDATSKRILLKPTASVDPLAIEDSEVGNANYANRQPWRLMFEVDNAEGGIRIWANTPTNVSIDSGTKKVKMARSGSAGSTSFQTSGLMTYKSWDESTSYKEKSTLLPD